MWINEVGVALTHRRGGIGKALTSALVHEARIRGCVCAWLGTASGNVAGQACFGAVPAVESSPPLLLKSGILKVSYLKSSHRHSSL
jgi:GNAT superfamily N-acetyltransferase